MYDIFSVVREVITALSQKGGLQFPIPVPKPNGVLGVVEEQLRPEGIISVDVLSRNWGHRNLLSAMFRRKTSAQIIYSVQASLPWRRFALCKEAMHLLNDTESCHFTTDPLLLIERLIVGDFGGDTHTPVGSEGMGIVAAIETLLPWQLRALLVEMGQAGASDFQIAAQTRVPERYVTAMLHGNYGKTSARINTELDGRQPQAATETT